MTSDVRVYLDTSAFSSLWGHRAFSDRELLRLRRRMTSPLFLRRPSLCIGVALLDELSHAHEKGPVAVSRLREQVELLQSCRPTMALAPDDAILAEIHGGSPLAEYWRIEELLNRVVDDPAIVAAERAMMRRRMRSWYDREVSRKDGLLKQFAQNEVGPATARWGRTLAEHVDDWARDELRKMVRRWKLPSNEASWPAPSSIPTLWNLMGFKLARLSLVHRDGRAIRENDLIDRDHWGFAAHTDVFVSEDRIHREITSLCPPPRPKVTDFETWARDLLADPESAPS